MDLDGFRSDYIPVPEAFDEDGNPQCTPRPAGRLPAAWDQVELPGDGAIGMNPDPEALTGLDSWFWYEGETEVEWASLVFAGVRADCSLVAPPAPVTHSARIVEWEYTIDDSRPATVSAKEAGSEDEPAATHVYRTKGEWEVTVRCTWELEPSVTTVTDCGQRVVPVIEVRPVRVEG